MLWPKNNLYKEFDNEKNSCSSKIPLPPPPITFLMVRPLVEVSYYWACDYVGVLPVRGLPLTSCYNVTL